MLLRFNALSRTQARATSMQFKPTIRAFSSVVDPDEYDIKMKKAVVKAEKKRWVEKREDPDAWWNQF